MEFQEVTRVLLGSCYETPSYNISYYGVAMVFQVVAMVFKVVARVLLGVL